MPCSFFVRSGLFLLIMMGLSERSTAQVTVIPFTSGPIPLCDTSIFTANVSGMGWLAQPGTPWSYSLNQLLMNITSDHPQTLQIFMTSPAGTELLLSEFNGAGGQNYTNTVFEYGWYPSIMTGTAPFTGSWTAQGGSFSVFDGENADGTWTITVIDTSCVNNGTGTGGIWTPGWFDGSSGNGGFSMGFSAPPPCPGYIPFDNATICGGGTFDLLGYYTAYYSGYSYTITLSGSPVTDPTAVSAPGNYWIDAYDMWDGCSYWAEFVIIASSPTPIGADQVVDHCGPDPMDLTALFNLTGVTPVWSLDGAPITGAIAAAATVPGTYQVIGETAGGCNDTALVTLNINAAAILGPDESVSVCPGGSLDLTSLYDVTGLTAVWTFGGLPFATPTAATDAGVYSLAVTNSSGCADQADVTLSVEPMAPLGADQTLALCSNATIDLTVLYTTTGLTSTWTLSGAPVIDPASVSAAGTYRLIASNASACADSAFVSVNVNPAPALGPDASASACEDGTVDLTTFFPTAGLTTAWTFSGIAVPDPVSVDGGGTYMLVTTDPNGCSDSALVSVTISTNPVLGADQTISVCDGIPVDLTTLYTTGADASLWEASGATVADPTSVTTSGTYLLTVTNAAGCSASATVALSFDPAPALGPDVTASICGGTTYDLTAQFATAGGSGSWTMGGNSVADPVVVNATGNYQLVVTNASGCTDTAMVALTAHTAPDLGEDQFFTLCPWQMVDLSAVFPVNGMDAIYTHDGQPISDPATVHEPGTYTVAVTDAYGCTDDAIASVINVECLCEADFRYDAGCMQEPVQFAVLADSAVVSATWNFSGAAPNALGSDPLVRFTSDEPTLVTLRATLSCGVVTVERMIRVPDCSDSCSVWIPSAFTPDGDGVNDTWGWPGECLPKDFSVKVFDRWGELVYTSTDPFKPWDGSHGGKPSPTGVYVYRVDYQLLYQERKEVTGTVTLVR